ncbi:hypothetical protein MAIT1_03954 [Magnetofaba australis IT-1]|uniref:Porin n=2 Tax=Magnetofaba TaxID=1472292 RepID=A0A1Y2K8T2_9PROT|nr:hypothetical protein MAIT1_03954 [Magnetofaba australis IT-1]
MPSPEQLWQMIQRQQRQIEQLKQKLGETDHAVRQVAETQAEPAKGSASLPDWVNRISLSGKIEVDATHSDDLNGDWNATSNDSASDIVVSTAEVDIAAQINPWANAHVTLKYEEDADQTRIQFDAGSITLGNTEKYPLWLTVGKEVVPFGNHSSAAFSDPLTLELGETDETAAIVGWSLNGFTAQGYLFNGDSRKSGDSDNKIESFGGMLGYAGQLGSVSLDAGVGYINSIEDGKIGDTLGSGGAAGNVDAISDHIGAWNVHAVLGMAGFSLIGEYFTAAEAFQPAELTWMGRGAKPRAWNLELDYETEIGGYGTTFGLAYGGTAEALDLGQPEARWIALVNVGILDGVSLGLEWAHSEDYGTADTGARVAAGTGGDRDVATLRLAAEF